MCSLDDRVLVLLLHSLLGVRNSLLSALQQQNPATPFNFSQSLPHEVASGLVIGGGATTRSAVHALYTLGMNPIFLVNRDAGEVEQTIKEFDAKKSDADGRQGVRLIHLTSVDQVEGLLGPNAKDRVPGIAMIVGAIPGEW